MHSFKFSENLIVGYFKYEGVGGELTYINSKSSKQDKKKVNNAYLKRNHDLEKKFFSQLINFLGYTKEQKKRKSALDISSATGQKSFWLADEGIGKVTASEIRKNQTNQLKLILDCALNERYKKIINAKNDLESADSTEYLKKYQKNKHDIVLSFGLLYHLNNPLQHLKNLYKISNKHVIIYTHTHNYFNCNNLWELTPENEEWITKAYEGISWKPHYHGLIDYCKKIGFKKVKMFYPDIFKVNYPYFDRTERYFKTLNLINKSLMKLGIKPRVAKNFEFSYYRYSNLNPNFYAYICEK